jgi:cyclic pyranopterin phosphate synthase
MAEFTHFDQDGNAHMVDVGAKAATTRTAIVKGHIKMQPDSLAMIQRGDAKKGDVLAVARLAGIMGAKQTAALIPLCHPLGLDHVAVEFVADPDLPGIIITATCKVTGPTGVEMEAMTAVSTAALTIMICVRRLIAAWKSAAFI